MASIAAYAPSATLASALVLGLLGAPAMAETPLKTIAGLQPHRAVYDLRLADRVDKSEIAAVNGRLVYEFVGSSCDGFSTQFRFVTRIENADGKARVTDLRTSSFEDGTGDTFEFLNQTFVQDSLTDESKGSTKRAGDGFRSTIVRPQERTIDLPADVNFPTRHMTRMIDAAKAGKTVTQVKLYDGSEGGARIFDTTAIIGKVIEGPDDVGEEKAAASPKLAGVKRWPMTISYFDPAKKERGEDTPEYQLSFLLYENGVSRKLRLDYGEFALEGRMIEMTPIDVKPCP